MVLEFNPKFDLGNVLTSLSVLVALAGLLYSFAKDRDIRRREYTDKVRGAAANALAKVDRYEALFTTFFEVIQASFTEADEHLISTRNVIATRDLFWKRANEHRSGVVAEISKEQLEISYAPLMTFRPMLYEQFRRAIWEAREMEDEIFRSFQEKCQDAILSFQNVDAPESAMLGNMLRGIAERHRNELQRRAEQVFGDMRGFLLHLLSLKDAKVFRATAGILINTHDAPAGPLRRGER